MLDWFKNNIVSAIAIFVSVATLTITGVKDSTATTSNLQTRMDMVERQMTVLPSLAARTANLETTSAVTNEILSDLKGAVSELSDNTKELTRVVTTVAVLNEKVENVENRLNNHRNAK